MRQPERIPHAGVPGTKHERTFIAIKPDGVHRHLVGDVVKRFEQKGYKLVGLKMLTPTIDQAREHYGDLSARPFFPALCAYFSSGPIVAMVWEGHGVIKGGRRLLGTTNPDVRLGGGEKERMGKGGCEVGRVEGRGSRGGCGEEQRGPSTPLLSSTSAQDSPPGSIRGDFCIQTGRNIIHGSDGPDSARAEISAWDRDERKTREEKGEGRGEARGGFTKNGKLGLFLLSAAAFWFKDGELNTWTPADGSWVHEK